MIIHFGCQVKTNEVHLTKDNYIHRSTEFEKVYWGLKSEIFSSMEERVAFRKKQALVNFDLNMAYYKSLDSGIFNRFIDEKIVRNKAFIEVKDLNDYICPGVYILVLDEYKQVYVGISDNVKKRIQQHWVNSKDLFRLIFIGGVTGSKLSIDSFRALDTTRIFVCTQKTTKRALWKEEGELVESFPDCFICNRMMGGDPYLAIGEKDCFKNSNLPKVTEENISELLPDYTWEEFCEFMDFTIKEQEDRRKGFAIREKEEENERIRWEKLKEDQKKQIEENIRLRDKQALELEKLGFNPKEDFPDYYNEYTGNAFVIYETIQESIKKGFDISIYKGLKSLDVQKVYICLDNGVPKEEAIDYADSYGRLMDLKESFKLKKKKKQKGKKK